MCAPALIVPALFLASTAIGAASAGLGYVGQRKAASAQNAMAVANAQTADNSYRLQQEQLNTRLQQQRSQYLQQTTEQTIQAEQLSAQAKVSAAESGVSGVSLDAILGQVNRELAKNGAVSKSNYDLAQLDSFNSERQAYYETLNRKNSVPFGQYPNMLTPILQTVGTGLNAYSSLYHPSFDVTGSTGTNPTPRYNKPIDLTFGPSRA